MLFLSIALALAQASAQASAQAPAQTSSTQPPAPPAPTKVLATLDGAPIKASELEAYLWDWRGSEALQDILSYKLAAAAAQKAHVVVTDKEAQDAFDKQIAEIKKSMPPQGSFDEALREQGYPKSRIYLRVKTELLVNKIVMLGFNAADYVKVATMVFRPQSEQAVALETAIKRADAAYAKLQGGATWDSVLAENESDPSVLQAKGILGWRAIATFPKTVAVDLRGLKTGSVTKPAQTPNGMQIFRIAALGTEAKGADLDDLKSYYLNTQRPAVLDKIRQQAKITRLYP